MNFRPPYPDMGGRYARMLETTWNAQRRAHAEAMAKTMGARISPPVRLADNAGLQAAMRALNSEPARAARARVFNSPQIRGVFAQTERFGGLFGDALARAVRPVVRLPQPQPAVPPSVIRALPKVELYRGFWDAMRTASEGLIDMMEDAREGGEALRAAEYGFADHMWNAVYLASFADIPQNVRDATVTRRLAAFTSSDAFVEPLLRDVGTSRMLRRRSRVLELALGAHRRREYALSIPPFFAQIEGAVGDAMFLKDLVVREGNAYYLSGPDGRPKVNKKGERLPPITLSPAVRNANLDENEDLAGASEFLSGVLVQRRNDVLHGRDVGYGKAKLSVQALLVLAVLAGGFEELEKV